MATSTQSARFALFLASLISPVTAPAQIADDYKPPGANCCLASTAQALAEQLLDWNQLGRYYADNETLKKQPADPKRVVFLGDSITDGWKLDEFFPGKPYVNRGIGGQTTPQILVRMFPDVIDLKPGAVILLAGTNDIARNTGPETAAMIQENIQAVTELAQLHGIKVILCSVTPVSDYTNGKQTVQRPPSDILRINTWLREYAAKVKASYVDYFPALADDKGMLKDGYSMDGLHPNHKGYELMAPLAEAAIAQALR
jgi:lysophospholipase L1-like esterase